MKKHIEKGITFIHIDRQNDVGHIEKPHNQELNNGDIMRFCVGRRIAFADKVFGPKKQKPNQFQQEKEKMKKVKWNENKIENQWEMSIQDVFNKYSEE